MPSKTRPTLAEALSLPFCCPHRVVRQDQPYWLCDFVSENEGNDLAFVHRFLARGLAKAAEKVPEAALANLLAGPKRLAIGDMHDVHGETRRLISSVGPNLSDEEIGTIERAIVSYKHHEINNRALPAQQKRELLKWNRAHRLDYLSRSRESALNARTSTSFGGRTSTTRAP